MLRRLGRLAALEPPRQVTDYERERPGELIPLDTRKPGRFDGIGHRISGDRTRQSRKRAAAVERGMTDNGSASRSRLFASVLKARGLAHRRPRRRTPRSNGKAERVIQTALRAWA